MACFQTRKDFDMSNRLPLGMAEATRLTQAGNLMGATALIQRLLQGGDVPEPAHTGSGSPTIIDMEPITPDAAAPRPAAEPVDTGSSLIIDVEPVTLNAAAPRLATQPTAAQPAA